MKKKKVAIWIRVSTQMQAQGQSPENHLKDAQMYAKLKKYDVVTVYDLAGVSGANVMEHPECQRMLSDIRSKKISGLIFSKLSRLTRKTRHLLEIAEVFNANNADLISIHENIDSSQPAGKMLFTMIGAFAEFERSEIASRVKNSMKIMAQEGKKLGGVAQYGFKWNEDKLELHPEESKIRAMMYELYLKHKRFKAVSRELEEKGFRSRKGKPFHSSTIKRWLKDPISKGKRRTNYSQELKGNQTSRTKPKNEWFFHDCPQIVSPEMWQEVYDLIDEYDKNRKPVPNRKVHIFTNYIHCGCCDSRMNVRSRMTHYKCVSKECTNKIRRDDLEEAFKSRLDNFFGDTEQLTSYFNQANGKYDEKKSEYDLVKIELSKVEEELKNIIHLHQQKQIPTEAFSQYHQEPFERSQQLQAQLNILERELESLKIEKKSADYYITESKYIFDNWDTYTRDKKRELVEEVIESVIIGSDTIDFNLKSLLPQKRHFSNSEKMGHKPIAINSSTVDIT
ncbi:recombinase family protein [Kordia sp.]|uniref:recombinase family protein n=1 Tax=Kordia sp. TaxID=1965332 RepID=UPI003D29E7E7